ncbi:hypothetical protein KK062_05750 [Fulvivirgaceae bacterium PWU5]|uniref:DUF7691 domain-containing protein n=1 Tax=Dawidia cretensis TaxID=2782350 RepID=A0AAP2GSY5_9BACT|nr:hypothetical protein [Dawidia cretensis]MBT1707713.1 hypothetical protein [Dawidia cretensis]
MGYYAQPFAVDLEKVRQVLGSKDAQLAEQIKASGLYDHYASESEADFEEIIDALIFQYIKPADRKSGSGGFFGLFKSQPSTGLDPKLAHEYGYALLVACDVFGTSLSTDDDIFYAGRVWKRLNELLDKAGATVNLDRMWGEKNLFDIPPINDFPGISHYSKPEIEHLLAVLEKIQPSEKDMESDDGEVLQLLISTFTNGLRTCREKGVEWVSFIH